MRSLKAIVAIVSVVLLWGCEIPLDFNGMHFNGSGSPDDCTLSVSPGRLDLRVGETRRVQVTGGTPPYACSRDTTIASCQVSGGEVLVKGISPGGTGLLVWDQRGCDALVNVVVTQ
jgi:hypothetical protein